jgi:hypothetical protein
MTKPDSPVYDAAPTGHPVPVLVEDAGVGQLVLRRVIVPPGVLRDQAGVGELALGVVRRRSAVSCSARRCDDMMIGPRGPGVVTPVMPTGPRTVDDTTPRRTMKRSAPLRDGTSMMTEAQTTSTENGTSQWWVIGHA